MCGGKGERVVDVGVNAGSSAGAMIAAVVSAGHSGCATHTISERNLENCSSCATAVGFVVLLAQMILLVLVKLTQCKVDNCC